MRRSAGHLAFAAPPLLQSGLVDDSLVDDIASMLGVARGEIVDAAWADNGPGWVAVLLPSADAILHLRPGTVGLYIGIVGPYPAGAACAFRCARSSEGRGDG